MKKSVVLLVILCLMIIGYSAYNATINLYGSSKIAENISDFKVYISSLKVNGNEVSGINDSKDGFNITTPVNGSVEVEITNASTEYDTEASLECELEDANTGKIWNYDYTGGEQTFIAPVTGTYKLETWGAQGGNINSYIGGYGGYSNGNINLTSSEKIYLNVGGTGNSYGIGGYNGGGGLRAGQYGCAAAGGGATHIATTSGLLSTLENNQNSILLVSAGGGGANHRSEGYGEGNGGSGGGYIGNNGETINHTNGFGYGYGTGGTQNSGGYVVWFAGTNVVEDSWKVTGTFGKSGENSYNAENGPQSGGGGGFFGGGGGAHGGGGGGSGYIANPLLTNKAMYCYNCAESNEVSTKTISTTCTSSTPTENCAKSGNGYSRITLLKSTSQLKTEKMIVEAFNTNSKKMESLSFKSLTCKLKLNKISRTEKKTYTGPTVWTYDYTGGEQTFITPVTGTYKLETWGAQGGDSSYKYIGGYGGYSVGNIFLKNNATIYINIGESGNRLHIGGYNGGGGLRIGQNVYGGSGGGATHMATSSGLLSTLENQKSNILIASGGGGGGDYRSEGYGEGNGGSGGGYIGNNGETTNHTNGYGYGYGTGGTQENGGKQIWIVGTTDQDNSWKVTGTFGKSGEKSYSAESGPQCGGGGGFYGGGSGNHGGAGGGSGYIGNTLLTNKAMYCYNCATSNDVSTKTISTTCTSSTPTENCAKIGNGYARITLISID